MRGYLTRLHTETFAAVERAILGVCPPRPGGRLVDLGCGNGRFTMSLAARVSAGETIGVDSWEPFIEAAAQRGVRMVRHDLSDPLPFEDASVDVVHSDQVIEHLPDTDLFVREIRRVLRPDGYAVICTNNLASWHNIFSLVVGAQPQPCHVSNEMTSGLVGAETPPSYPQHLRIFTERSLRALCAHHGLRTDLARGVGYYPLPPRLAEVAARVDETHAAYLLHRVAR